MYSNGRKRQKHKEREFISSQCNNFQTVCFKMTAEDKPDFTILLLNVIFQSAVSDAHYPEGKKNEK